MIADLSFALEAHGVSPEGFTEILEGGEKINDNVVGELFPGLSDDWRFVVCQATSVGRLSGDVIGGFERSDGLRCAVLAWRKTEREKWEKTLWD
jgi:hypothetical protein